MKSKLLVIVLLLISNIIYAQNKTGNKVSKADKAAQIEMQYLATENLIDSNAFVLTADFLSNRYGYRRIAEPTLNFIEIDSSDIVIQTGNSFGMGYNGIGGLTVKGRIMRWDVNKDPVRKTFTIKISVSSSLGFYDIFINVSASGKAIATVSGMRGQEVIFEGNLSHIDEFQTYQGTSI